MMHYCWEMRDAALIWGCFSRFASWHFLESKSPLICCRRSLMWALWSTGTIRFSNLIAGSLNINPTSTLTYADRYSVIDVLLSKHFNSSSIVCTLLLDVKHKEVIGEKANYFVSFAYVDNETKFELLESNTYFWFDTFMNEQSSLDWWANAF